MFGKKRENLPIIVVGAGSVGISFVQELFHQNPSCHIKIFGEESERPYRRENLSEFLSGRITRDDLRKGKGLPDSKHIQTYFSCSVSKIDAEKSLVIDSLGVEHPYHKLVLATGANPIVPNIPGTDLENVIVFRNLKDADALVRRKAKSRHTLVIGGDYIALDAANAMNQGDTKVTVFEHRRHLMFNQLDQHASVYLGLYLDDIGIDVFIETTVQAIEGENKVSRVVMDDGDKLECDTVIIAIGIKPRVELASNAGLKVSRGIVINDYLETSHPGIYAIGECTEYRGKTWNLAKPGIEQAKILARNLAGRKPKRYSGTTSSIRLKVIDYPFLTVGQNSEDDMPKKSKVLMYRDIRKMTYRKLVLKNGFLRGIVEAGRWEESADLVRAVEQRKYIWPWQRLHFVKTGRLD